MPTAALGDEVVVLGSQRPPGGEAETITLSELAQEGPSHPNWEICCTISKRVPRVYVGEVRPQAGRCRPQGLVAAARVQVKAQHERLLGCLDLALGCSGLREVHRPAPWATAQGGPSDFLRWISPCG